MTDFIDISYAPSAHDYPYLIMIFEGGGIKEITGYTEIAAVAARCKEHQLAVMSAHAQVIKELASYGIEVHPFRYRSVGE